MNAEYDEAQFNCEVCNPFFHQAGEKGILLIHGFTGSVAHMRPLGDALYACGYTVMGINLPGHATTEHNMGKVGHRDWLKAAQNAVRTLSNSCESVTVCGLSMGAILALILAQEHRVDACITISAPMPSNNLLLPFAGILGLFIPRITWSANEERTQQLDQRFDKSYAGFPTRKGADLHHLIQQAKRNLPQVKCPTLIVQSKDDQTINLNSADTIFKGISSTQKEKLMLEGVPHVCTISGKLASIVDAVDGFMKTL